MEDEHLKSGNKKDCARFGDDDDIDVGKIVDEVPTKLVKQEDIFNDLQPEDEEGADGNTAPLRTCNIIVFMLMILQGGIQIGFAFASTN